MRNIAKQYGACDQNNREIIAEVKMEGVLECLMRFIAKRLRPKPCY